MCLRLFSMAIRAVAFDIGGVLERVDDPAMLTGKWRERLGMTSAEFDAALATVDPDDVIETGGLSEAEFASRYAEALRLSTEEQQEFMADFWDWYCGELDTELTAFAASLRRAPGGRPPGPAQRPRLATAILSNRRTEPGVRSSPGTR